MFLKGSFMADATHLAMMRLGNPNAKRRLVIVFHPLHIASQTFVETERCSMPPLYRINLCGHCCGASHD